MQRIDLTSVEHLLEGHVDVRRRPGSIQPLRYPAAEHEYYDVFTRWVASAPAGVRLRLRTDSSTLELKVRQRTAAFNDTPRAAVWRVLVDGEPYGEAAVAGGAFLQSDGSLKGDERATVRIELPPSDNEVEIWLPQTATVSIDDVAIADGAHWAPWPDHRKRLVFHGSSITHCMEANTAAGAWPAVAARLADVNHINLGWAGSCLLSGLAARIVRDQKADGIVLKLGINVHGEALLKERTFLDSAHSMLSIIREKHAATPLVVISPIWSPPREDAAGPGGGPSLKRMRELLQTVVAARQKSGDDRIRYLSGLELFGPADRADLPDELHPNTAGYQRMGERFHKLMLSGKDSFLLG
jgi:lysophospholipase L1-like esterase